MVGGRLPQKRVTIEVTGPKSLLPEPVTRSVNFNLTFRDFLRGIVGKKNLVGCKVTKVKGTWSTAVCLDSIIKDFIQFKFSRKMDCYRIRLMKLQNKKRVVGTPESDQVVYAIDDDEDVTLVEPAPSPAVLAPPTSNPPANVVDDQQPCSSRSILTQIPVEPPNVESASPSVHSPPTSIPPSDVVDDEQPTSSRSFLERTARKRMPPPAPHFKRETWSAAYVKSEFPDAESTIGFLREKGVAIDNLKEQVQERMGEFKNPFLLLLKEELVQLRNSAGPQWQSLVGKAPRCVHLLGELFDT